MSIAEEVYNLLRERLHEKGLGLVRIGDTNRFLIAECQDRPYDKPLSTDVIPPTHYDWHDYWPVEIAMTTLAKHVVLGSGRAI